MKIFYSERINQRTTVSSLFETLFIAAYCPGLCWNTVTNGGEGAGKKYHTHTHTHTHKKNHPKLCNKGVWSLFYGVNVATLFYL